MVVDWNIGHRCQRCCRGAHEIVATRTPAKPGDPVDGQGIGFRKRADRYLFAEKNVLKSSADASA